MATYDHITIGGKKDLCLNIDGSVGAGGRNQKGDVMLIQAMLIYFAPFEPLLSGKPALVVPELTGVFDATTAEAIRNYQQSRAHLLLNLDGIIHRPKYKNRNLKNSFVPLMTMTLMHVNARKTAKFYAHAHYATGIPTIMPKLDPYLRLPSRVTSW